VSNYKVVDLDKFLLSAKPEPADRPYAGITFDDGYKDILTNAYPLLKHYGLPFNIFVVTNCVETGLPPWTFVLDYIFMHTSIMENKVAELMPPAFKTAKWSTTEERILYAKRLKPFLKECANDYREKVVHAYTDCFSDVKVPDNLLLTWEDLNYLKDQGVNIGSHSHTHPLLGKMELEASIAYEFKTSYDIINSKLGTPPVSISYPVGSVDERVKRIAKEAGYKIGFAVNNAEYNSEKQDLFEIPRIEFYNESLFKTKLRANGVIQTIKNYLYLKSRQTD
jgi:peptidoglycan/xylan/chitin deacetylase (PgdA/CDA1 family)